MISRLSKAFAVYFVFCVFLAFIDFDWNAKSAGDASASTKKQTMYMNSQQKIAYVNDLEAIASAGRMGGATGRLLHGKEVTDIHKLANQIRINQGVDPVPFPSKTLYEHVLYFFVVPFRMFL